VFAEPGCSEKGFLLHARRNEDERERMHNDSEMVGYPGYRNSPSQAEGVIADSTLGCELITTFSRLQELSADWDRLWRADPEAEIFQSFAWACAWWRCYGGKVELLSLAVLEGQRVIGIVPLVKDRDRIFFLAGMQADYCDILCESGRAAEVFVAALNTLLQLPGWKECVLRNLKVGGRISKQLTALPKKLRQHLQITPGGDCHTIMIEGNRDVLGSLLGKKHTKRRLNKLRKAGTLTFHHIETKAEAQAQLSDFFRHQMRSRALAGKRSSAPEFNMFLRNLVEELDLTKELRFGVLALNGRPLAWHFSFHVNGKWVFYQQTFDVDAGDYSPGEVLIHKLLHYAQENVTREFDFGRGDEPFKDRFITDTQETYSLCIEPAGIQGQVRRVLRASAVPYLRLGRRAQRLAKRHDETLHRFRSIRLWASGVQARIRYHRHQRTLIAWAVKAVARPVRSVRFGRAQIDLFPVGNHVNIEAAGVGLVSSPHLNAREGGVGDLVDIALRHPEILVPSELGRYRQRLKKGDRVYVVCQGEEVVLAGWTTTRRPEDIRALKTNQRVFGNAPLMLLYECLAVSSAVEDVHYRQLLCRVSTEAQKKQLVLCAADGLGFGRDFCSALQAAAA
jgi:CelD/BcsL family acetyltransferase involved in cellulose biosynthesis